MKKYLPKKQWFLIYILLILVANIIWAADSQYDSRTGKLTIPKVYVEPNHDVFQHVEVLLKHDGTWLVTDFELHQLTPLISNNPPLNSVKTAHGNTDWHIDTAEEFLFGTGMSGTVTAVNHVPNSWTRDHMHIGLTDTNHFYQDPDKTAVGDDDDVSNGIDTTMLFFYAGHGSPTSWDTLGNYSTQNNISIGDGGTWAWSDSNRLRYYWQCSCEVFAHGPRSCASSDWHYACPGNFDGSADSFSMRNVYERWGPALGKNLRMACGASTSAYCHESQTNRIWDNYNNKGYDVADSFIDGLHFGKVVPLCITMGGPDVTKSPLYDAVFTNQPNSSGTSYYHIQYLSNFASKLEWPRFLIKIPEFLPLYKMAPMELPAALEKVEFIKLNEDLRVSGEEIQGRGPRYKINNKSGAVYMVGEPRHELEKIMNEKEYLEIAAKFLEESGLKEEEMFEEPLGVRRMISSTAVKSYVKRALLSVPTKVDLSSVDVLEADQVKINPDIIDPFVFNPEEKVSAQKNVQIIFKRVVRTQEMEFDVLGEGGAITIQMNNDGSIRNVSKVWRRIEKDSPIMVKVKSFDNALDEARKQIENFDLYELKENAWAFGYKESSGNVDQSELKAVYQFRFTPINTDEKTLLEAPPVMIEILAQEI